MRLWSLHPHYLDRQGLLAVWREGLLAQKVLLGKTKGYKNHPQLDRFKNNSIPLELLGGYLYEIYLEAKQRGYNFNHKKIKEPTKSRECIYVTTGQLEYEYHLLCLKLEKRDMAALNKILWIPYAEPHPLFKVVEGDIEKWEKIH